VALASENPRTAEVLPPNRLFPGGAMIPKCSRCYDMGLARSLNAAGKRGLNAPRPKVDVHIQPAHLRLVDLRNSEHGDPALLTRMFSRDGFLHRGLPRKSAICRAPYIDRDAIFLRADAADLAVNTLNKPGLVAIRQAARSQKPRAASSIASATSRDASSALTAAALPIASWVGLQSVKVLCGQTLYAAGFGNRCGHRPHLTLTGNCIPME